MSSVAIHPPKTPVTKGSNGVAAATVPNVCKMPGPPAPFVPTPLPNVGRSGLNAKGYSTSVKIEGQPVAIRGASFGSVGDIASKGTGGGVVSNNVEGPTKFIAPGSLTVHIQGKNVHLLSDVMSNNNGPAGSPANAATMAGLGQTAVSVDCPCDDLRREPPEGQETRSTEELAQSLDEEADRLDTIAAATDAEALAAAPADQASLRGKAKDQRKGAADKRFEALVARDTRAKEVSVKLICKKCGKVAAEFDVITGSGVIKECKNGGKAIDIAQFYKEKRLAPPGATVHLAVPGDGTQRKKAIARFKRPGGREMTNKGRGYNREIQEH